MLKPIFVASLVIAFVALISIVSAPLPALAFDASKYGQVSDAQTQILQAVEKARADYAAAANDMARGGVRAVRARAVCTALKGKPDIVWIGQITELSSNGDGYGVLTVSIGPDVTLKTWNNSFSDIGFNTLINPGNPLFEKVSKLKEGAIVKVRGKLFPYQTDCVREASITLGGSISDPEYIFKFVDVTAVE